MYVFISLTSSSELRITVRENRSQISAVAAYKSHEVAQKAVESLANTKLEDTTLSVELFGRSPKRTNPRTATRGRGRASGRATSTRGQNLTRQPREDVGEEGTSALPEEPVPSAQPEDARATEIDVSAQPNAPAKANNGRAKKPKAPKKAKEAQGVPSKTLLFVSHLSYSVKNEDLMELFSAYPAISANIVYHRQQPKHSRGFAFVGFPNEEAQQKALAENNGKEVHGRTIAISVALQPEESASTEKPANTEEPAEVSNATA